MDDVGFVMLLSVQLIDLNNYVFYTILTSLFILFFVLHPEEKLARHKNLSLTSHRSRLSINVVRNCLCLNRFVHIKNKNKNLKLTLAQICL